MPLRSMLGLRGRNFGFGGVRDSISMRCAYPCQDRAETAAVYNRTADTCLEGSTSLTSIILHLDTIAVSFHIGLFIMALIINKRIVSSRTLGSRQKIAQPVATRTLRTVVRASPTDISKKVEESIKEAEEVRISVLQKPPLTLLSLGTFWGMYGYLASGCSVPVTRCCTHVPPPLRFVNILDREEH